MNLLLACLVFTQDKSPEAVFKDIEDLIAKARALSVSFRAEGENSVSRVPRLKTHFSGQLMIAEGNRVRLTYHRKAEYLEAPGRIDESQVAIVSDGKTLWHRDSSDNDGALQESAAAPHFEKNLRLALSRTGFGTSILTMAQSGFKFGKNKEELDFNAQYAVRDLKIEETESGGLLSHKILQDQQEFLWYDPKSLQPSKLELRFQAGNERSVLTVTYEKWQADPVLTEDIFKPPGK